MTGARTSHLKQRLSAKAGAPIACAVALVTATACQASPPGAAAPASLLATVTDRHSLGEPASCTVPEDLVSIPDLELEQARSLAGQGVTACLVPNATYRGRTLRITETTTSSSSWTVVVPGQPVPAGCAARQSEILYLLVSGTYYRARDVGCRVPDSSTVTHIPGTPSPPPSH